MRGIDDDTWHIGVAKLISLDCVRRHVETGNIVIPAPTAFGRGLLAAYQSPASAPIGAEPG